MPGNVSQAGAPPRGPSRIPAWLPWGVFFALLFASRFVALTDPDIFMHVRTGQWMLEHRAIPRADSFTVFGAGEPWTNHQWLAQLAMGAIAAGGGMTALSVVRAFLLAGAFVLSALAMRERGVSRWPALAALALGALAAWGYSAPRPYLATFLGMAWLAWAWAAWRNGAGWQARMLYFAPGVFLAWANLHAGFTAGLLFLAALVAGETAEALIAMTGRARARHAEHRRNWRRAGRLWLALGGCALAVCINPAGPRILLFWRTVVGRDLLEAMILEWNPPALEFDFLPYYALLALLAAGFMARPRSIAPGDWLAAGGFALMSLTARRHIPLLVFAALPILADHFEAWRRRLPENAGVPARFPFIRVSLPRFHHCAAALLALAGLLWARQMAVREYTPLGVGLHPLAMPRTAAQWLQASPLQPNLFNSFNFGGYLIGSLDAPWRAFIDGRVDIYGPRGMRDYIQWTAGRANWRGAFEQYGINAAMIDYALDGKVAALGRALWDDPAWALVYWDDVAMIFARRDSISKDALAAIEYRAANPLESPADLLRQNPEGPARERLKAELARAAGGDSTLAGIGAAAPSQLRAVNFIATLHAFEGRLDEAERACRRELERQPRAIDLRFRLAEILDKKASELIASQRSAAGFEALAALDEAERAYKEALRLDRSRISAWTRIGALRERRGDLNGALAAYRRAKKINPASGEAAFHEARALALLGRDRDSLILWEQLTASGLRDPAVYHGMAELYERLGEPAEAFQALKEAQRLAPDDAAIAQELESLMVKYGVGTGLAGKTASNQR